MANRRKSIKVSPEMLETIANLLWQSMEEMEAGRVINAHRKAREAWQYADMLARMTRKK
jgi:hypothetical protein